MSRPGVLRARATFAGAFMLALGSAAAAEPSAHLEVGYGASTVRDLPSASTSAFSACAGIGFSAHPVRVALELAATGSADMSMHIPESPMPGQRTLTTLLIGFEAVEGAHTRGPFAVAGVGIGHATLTGAEPGMLPAPGAPIPDRSLTDLAVGAGLGWRSTGGPGPLGFQLALRYHAVVHEGDIAASAAAFTLGLAY
jgi:hypothetical protein